MGGGGLRGSLNWRPDRLIIRPRLARVQNAQPSVGAALTATPLGLVHLLWISATQPPQYWQCQHGRGAKRPWALGVMIGSTCGSGVREVAGAAHAGGAYIALSA